MQTSGIPSKFPIPFAKNATAGFIRAIPQTSGDPAAASLDLGFPPATATPVGAGGTPPNVQDENGILNQLSAWCQWLSAGGAAPYDGTFSTAIGGYPLNAIVLSAVTPGLWWLSTAENNTTDPDAGGAGWQPVARLGGSSTTGDMKFQETAAALPGWVIANATTIGNASSNATQRANADTARLFAWHWANFSNTQCPVYTSGGVLTTRGVSAAADFAANKAIAVRDWRGRSPIGVDTMQGSGTTYLNGVPVISGGTTVPGSVFGENQHTLTTPEIPIITPAGTISSITPSGTVGVSLNDPGHQTTGLQTVNGFAAGGLGNALQAGGGGHLGPNFTGITVSGTSFTGNSTTPTFTGNAFGGGGAHNNVPLSNGVTWYIKL